MSEQAVSHIQAGYSVSPAERDLYRTVIIHGTPATPPPAMAAGITLTKTIFDMGGTPLDPDTLHQNQRFIVALEGEAQDQVEHRAVLVDLLPVGWEIEAVIRPDQAPAFLNTLSQTTMREMRDDRLVAAFNIAPAPNLVTGWRRFSPGSDGKTRTGFGCRSLR